LYGYADKSGAIVIPARYKYAESFSEGFAVVGDDTYVEGTYKFSYIDRRGVRSIPGEFEAASPFFKGLAHVHLFPRDEKRTRESFAYIDTKGRRVFSY
jgi:hypothetical protein